MKVEFRKLSEIKPYENNPRHNDSAVDAVAESIREFGFRQPIVVDKDGVIIVGHTRYKAALKLGLEQVPVHVATDLTPEQARAYRIADNRSSELSDWNYELLAIELEALSSTNYLLPEQLLPVIPNEHDNILPNQAYVELGDQIYYTPQSKEPPAISTLFDASYAMELMREAEVIGGELGEFLKLSAVRHVRFHFNRIAEYYAHADEKIREIFRKHLLVLVDPEEAIKRGWLKVADEYLAIEKEYEELEGEEENE